MSNGTGDMLDPIAKVEAVTAAVRLETPVRLGSTTVSAREFVFVRVTTEAGLEGKAFVLSRGQPIVEIVDRDLAPLLIGADADLISARVGACHRAVPAPVRVGARTKAVSLIEIALWDVKAQRADAPLWRLLGGQRRRVPAMLVAGYLGEDGDPEELGARVAELAQDGFPLVKIARAATPDLTRRLIASAQEGLPSSCRLVVDAAWVWPDANAAAEEIRSWEARDLAWIEDPFVPGDVRSAARLKARNLAPLAIGDEVTDPHQLLRLIEADALDIVRIDATSVGGIDALRGIAAVAIAAGLDVSPHLYPEVHVHCAAAWPGVRCVELFERETPLYPIHLFVAGGPTLDEGHLVAPESPGLGYEVDWERVHAVSAEGGV